MCTARVSGPEDDVSIFCVGGEPASKEERERMDDGLETLERPKVSMVELRRTALFRRPAHLGFGLAPLFMLGNNENLCGLGSYAGFCIPTTAGGMEEGGGS